MALSNPVTARTLRAREQLRFGWMDEAFLCTREGVFDLATSVTRGEREVYPDQRGTDRAAATRLQRAKLAVVMG